jgi:small subunit ribosomal protein S2
MTTQEKTKSGNKNPGKFQKNKFGKKSFIETKRKALAIGDICRLTISAVAPNNIGIDETTNNFLVFVPNTNIGDVVNAKIEKLVKTNILGMASQTKYAIAQLEEVLTNSEAEEVKTAVKPGDILDVKIQTQTSKGGTVAVVGNSSYKVIIPSSRNSVNNPKIGETVKVEVTRAKQAYAFAKLTTIEDSAVTQNANSSELSKKSSSIIVNGKELKEGMKFTVNLPTSELVKKYGKFLIVKLAKGTVVFIKRNLNAKPGDKVRVKLSKVANTFCIGEITELNPMSVVKKQAIVRNSLQQMVKSGMHFGEKAVKCHARMKNYIWYSKKNVNSLLGDKGNRTLIKKGRHIINLFLTRRCLNKALNVCSKYALKGRTFLFIGTKKPAAGLIARAALFSKTSYFVNTRWLGGMLTNWKTINKSISKIKPILKEKQKIVRDILEKRQNIKTRLLKKALLLKKKSKLILAKGSQLISLFQNPTNKSKFIENATKLNNKLKDLYAYNQTLLKKHKLFFKKRRELMEYSQVLKEKGMLLSGRYQTLLTQLVAYNKKLREYKYLLMISKEISALKQNANKQNVNVYSVTYSKLKEVNNKGINTQIIPNPPKEILNQIVLTMQSQYWETAAQGLAGTANTSCAGESASSVTAKTTSSNEKTNLVLSKLLSKFSRFVPFIKTQINKTQKNIKELETLCQGCFTQLTQIVTTLTNYVKMKNALVTELQNIKTKLTNERKIFSIVKKKLKQFATQKRLIKLLPRLRYLPTPQAKIYQTVQYLMKKIVDPKLKYPIDQIYDQKLSTSSKKVAAARKKNWQRLEKYFGGIANMTKLNKANIQQNVAIIVGQREEMNAVRECKKLGIKTFNIVDTNCNPTLANHIIPANDDSRNSIKYVLHKFLTRIRLAQKLRQKIQRMVNVNKANSY